MSLLKLYLHLVLIKQMLTLTYPFDQPQIHFEKSSEPITQLLFILILTI